MTVCVVKKKTTHVGSRKKTKEWFYGSSMSIFFFYKDNAKNVLEVIITF